MVTKNETTEPTYPIIETNPTKLERFNKLTDISSIKINKQFSMNIGIYSINIINKLSLNYILNCFLLKHKNFYNKYRNKNVKSIKNKFK